MLRYRLIVLPLAAAFLGCNSKDAGAPLPYNDLVHACVRSTACDVKAYPRVSNCIDAYYNQLRGFGIGPSYDSIYACINAARSCEDMYNCYGTSQLAGACDQSFAARCEGDRAISCDLLDDRVYIVDCAISGLKCEVKSTNAFEASCSPGKCDTSYKRRCDGNKLLSCNDGVIVIEDCGADGLVCGESQPAMIQDCVGEQQESCMAGQYKASCEGNAAVTCVNGTVHKRDCALNITKTVCSEGNCVEKNKDCLDDFDRCSGNNLETCIDGRWVGVNCGELGLGNCQPATNGASCGPPGS